MTVLVSVYCFRLVVEVFHQFFLCFSEMLLGCISFRPDLKCDVLDLGYLFVFPSSCQNLFCIRQEFLSIVFCKVECDTCKRVLFLGRFENFLYHFDKKVRDQVYFSFHLRLGNNVLFSLRILL